MAEQNQISDVVTTTVEPGPLVNAATLTSFPAGRGGGDVLALGTQYVDLSQLVSQQVQECLQAQQHHTNNQGGSGKQSVP